MNSITKRWMRGSLLITILVLLMAESVFLYFTISNYYDGARRAIMMRINSMSTQLEVSSSTPDGRSIALRGMVEQFEEKDKFELELISHGGNIATSTTGFTHTGARAGSDYDAAQSSDTGIGQATYRTETGEKVMSVTYLLRPAVSDVAAIRMLTSLELLDKNIIGIAITSLAIVLMVVLFSFWSGIFFIRSIVRPIGVIEATATKIAHGNLDIRIENKYNDEIGSLCNTINAMASELDKSEKMKNDFISSVSHELRTPLTAIKGWVETIGHMNPSDEGYKRGVEVIASETDRLYNMVEELLDFSRMQNGITLTPELLDLVAEVSDSVLMMEQRARLENVSIEFDEPEMPIPVQADKNRLRQVFVNVIDNAIKYSLNSSTIHIGILQDEVNVYVNISDEGAGIASEDLENVKLKFFKGAGSVRGSGIGLAVVDEIVMAHGGLLSIESEKGKGTTVTVRLPIYKKKVL
ncbi:MAG: HAMP domain-containing sensor histidine kinase [Oscillospiraceae bacterium]